MPRNGLTQYLLGKHTYEGRDMRVIEINKAGPNAPIAWIEAGIHAR